MIVTAIIFNLHGFQEQRGFMFGGNQHALNPSHLLCTTEIVLKGGITRSPLNTLLMTMKKQILAKRALTQKI